MSAFLSHRALAVSSCCDGMMRCFFDSMVDKLRRMVENAGVGDGGQEDAPERMSRTHVCMSTTRTRRIHCGAGMIFDNLDGRYIVETLNRYSEDKCGRTEALAPGGVRRVEIQPRLA
jgi:hypothetical protein